MKRSIWLGLAIAVAAAALSGVAQAGAARSARSSSPAAVQISEEAPPIAEVDFRFYNPCDCPHRATRHADVYVHGNDVVSYKGGSTEGDGTWIAVRLVTKVLCEASDRTCWLWTHEHRVNVGPVG
jgi:hypothetical protein